MPDGVSIRTETDADHASIRRVVAAAFGSDAEADLVEAIRVSPEYVAELAMVAVLDDEIVGHVMISGAVLRDADRHRRIVMLSPLAVDPAHQGYGIGAALVRTAVAAADELGEPFVVLEGDPAYYGRFGFEPAARHAISMPIPDWATPDAAQVLRLTADDPALRGDVVYPPAFDGV